MADDAEHTGAAAAADAAGNAGPAPAPGEPPPLPPTATVLAGKAKDLQALRDAVVDAANVGAGLWFSYLFVLFYLLIAAGSVTHRDLFLQSPVKLPFLNVDLPLLGFFVLGPAIFLIVHAYVLLHFVLLAGKVGDFDAELRAQIPDEEVRRRLRRQLPSNIFVQFLAGSREVRSGVMGFLLRLIAQISLVIGPIALLVFFQLQFLPYHDEAITWWHRIAVLTDIALLWMLWPSIARGETARLVWRDLRRGKILALGLASLAPVLLVTTIATFPGELLDGELWQVEANDQRQAAKEKKEKPWGLASLRELLVHGDVDGAARKPKSLWSNRLVLPAFDAIDHAKFDNEEKIKAASETISLRGRHLEGAVLIGTRFRKADFTGAQLQGAQLDSADLRDAKFDCGSLEDPLKNKSTEQCVKLQGASLSLAELQDASLHNAQLQGASLYEAQLQGASLDHAQLQGATLFGTALQGADLEEAQLQGADLEMAQLQGANLSGAQLQGAWMSEANFDGALLCGANLEVAFINASLDGVSLDDANLQGTDFGNASLDGASLKDVSIWRADAREPTRVWDHTRVVAPKADPIDTCEEDQKPPSPCPWTSDSLEKLKKMIPKQVPAFTEWVDAMERIKTLAQKPLEGEEEMLKVWQGHASSSHAAKTYEKHVAAIWQQTGCAATGAPYVLRGLISNLENGCSPLDSQSPQPNKLAKAFLDEKHCAGAHGLTDTEKAKLREIRDRSPPPALKQ